MRARILLFALASFLLAPAVLGQPIPLDRAEILGRLGYDFSPSFIAHLIHTRGIEFSPSDSFLTQVKLAGGDGILVERLSHGDSSGPAVSPSQEDRPVEHLARCVELIHIADLESAEPECRASTGENPSSPWPLLIVSKLVMGRGLSNSADSADSDGTNTGTSEYEELQHRAAVVDPHHLATSEYEAGSGNPSEFSSKNGVPEVQAVAPIPIFLGAIPPDPDLASTHRGLAYGYFVARDFENAQRELKEAIRLEPDHATNHTRLASLYLSSQNEDGAIAELREASRIAPFDSWTRGTLSAALEKFGRTSEAIAELKSLLTLSPRNLKASNDLIELYLKHKDRKSAITELQRSLKASSLSYRDDGKFVEARSEDVDRLAELLKQDRQLEAAVEQYRLLLRYQPKNSNWHNNYGNVLMDEHHADDAIAEYNLALRYDPTMSSAHHNIGLYLSQKRDFDGAIDEFRKALELNPEDSDTRFALADALAQKGVLNEAKDQFQQYLDKNSKDAVAHVSLAHVLSGLKDTPTAIKELKIALELDPNCPLAQNNLALIYATAEDLKLRNPAEALVLAQKAVKGTPKPDPAFLDTLAEALLLNGRPGEALKIEKEAAVLDPDNPAMLERVAHFEAAYSASQSSQQ